MSKGETLISDKIIPILDKATYFLRSTKTTVKDDEYFNSAKNEFIKLYKILYDEGYEITGKYENLFETAGFLDAIEFDDADMVEKYLKAGADPRGTEDWHLLTPLHHAVLHDSIKAAIVLLDHGADPLQGDVEGLTPIDWAIDGNHTRMAGFLLGRINLENLERNKPRLATAGKLSVHS